MNKIRLYFWDNSHKDFICESISLQQTSGMIFSATIIGGEHDGKIYHDTCGAKVLRR